MDLTNNVFGHVFIYKFTCLHFILSHWLILQCHSVYTLSKSTYEWLLLLRMSRYKFTYCYRPTNIYCYIILTEIHVAVLPWAKWLIPESNFIFIHFIFWKQPLVLVVILLITLYIWYDNHIFIIHKCPFSDMHTFSNISKMISSSYSPTNSQF